MDELVNQAAMLLLPTDSAIRAAHLSNTNQSNICQVYNDHKKARDDDVLMHGSKVKRSK
jgi:hypothetical protein